MEHISEILRRQAQTNTPDKNTETSSSTETEAEPAGPVCLICQGAKFVHPLLPSGKPDFSQVVPCRCAGTAAGAGRQSRLLRYSNLGPLARLTFDTLNPRGKSDNPANQEQFRQAWQTAKEFAAQPDGWLVLTGPSGSGKTHLAAAIANHGIENNRPAFYITAPDLLDHLRATFNPNSEMPFDEFFEQVRNAPLLVLDDLGAQSATPWAREKLDQLLNHRFNNRLPTVIVSIVPFEDLEERLRTRLAAARLCRLSAVDDTSSALMTTGWAPQFKREQEMTFDNFDHKRRNLPLEQRENLAAAFNLARDYAAAPEGWLVFQGVNGCGKTHLAAAIVNARYQQGQPALFIVVPDLLDHLRSTFSPESKLSYDHYFEAVKNTPLLVLDDFGRQTTSPWAREKLYQLVNHRYNAQLPTVITTNCTTDELDNPISSRFVDPKNSMIFTVTAPDYWSGAPGR